jgi:hypothetical protein
MDILPRLVIIANYLNMNSMLKDSLQQLCHQLSENSTLQVDNILSQMIDPFFDTLLHCINPFHHSNN